MSENHEGQTWSEPPAVIADTDPTVVDDKESITADPRDSRLVCAVWDRLEFTDATQSTLLRGPTWFARTVDSGVSWGPVRAIYDPGLDAQTIANQIVVLPGGTLVNRHFKMPGATTRSCRSRTIEAYYRLWLGR